MFIICLLTDILDNLMSHLLKSDLSLCMKIYTVQFFQIDEIYHFDLFLAETRRCTSELLFQVEDTTFSQSPATELPLDYR